MTPKQAHKICFDVLRARADNLGYCLVAHGSMKRRTHGDSDLDLLATPWKPIACEPIELVTVLHAALKEFGFAQCDFDQTGWEGEEKPHGRHAWAIYIDDELYIDLSVFPPTP